MTLPHADHNRDADRPVTEAESISAQGAARRAVRQAVEWSEHRGQVEAAAALVMARHVDALRRLGE